MSSQESNQKKSKLEQSSKKYRILTFEDKQKIMKVLQYNNTIDTLSTLSAQYKTSIKNLRRWYNEGINRKPGCGRKKLNLEAEKKLCVWIIEQSAKQGKRIRRTQLKDQAISLFNDKYFKASKAWQDEFIRNYDIKYQVNEILYKKGMLNTLQKQKFLEMQEKRNAETNEKNTENTSNQSNLNQSQIPTQTKSEENNNNCQTSAFCQDDYQWFQTPQFDVKFEESFNQQQFEVSPQINPLNEDSWDYKINQEESQASEFVGFNCSKKTKKQQKKKRSY
ncbi:unnamed protein product [Paramecium primaurelia]|uniref:HTH CENPB-type domain-containing protein n=1 Tax=Paramecium primaurelia TaxID=5886 RepID=A0A8S1KWL5_PARPR|nr:unnamed protein product [Paramecium primaurelia]